MLRDGGFEATRDGSELACIWAAESPPREAWRQVRSGESEMPWREMLATAGLLLLVFVPMIVLSAIGSGQEARCREAGAVDVLTKPFEPEDLDRAIRVALGG